MERPSKTRWLHTIFSIYIAQSVVVALAPIPGSNGTWTSIRRRAVASTAASNSVTTNITGVEGLDKVHSLLTTTTHEDPLCSRLPDRRV